MTVPPWLSDLLTSFTGPITGPMKAADGGLRVLMGVAVMLFLATMVFAVLGWQLLAGICIVGVLLLGLGIFVVMQTPRGVHLHDPYQQALARASWGAKEAELTQAAVSRMSGETPVPLAVLASTQQGTLPLKQDAPQIAEQKPEDAPTTDEGAEPKA